MTEGSECKPSIEAVGVQLRHDRYPRRSPAPPLQAWRTNLTGLSHQHNLYFVACIGFIYVYEPLFPTQSLAKDPALIIDTAPSRSGLEGYLDPGRPHAINNLVVQHLGNEEVLAVVRDDGDVDAYLTRHLAEAVSGRRDRGNSLKPFAYEIRPFFHQNVGNSAWGLAIHTQARMIAVSSNNHEFNIFAFALLDKAESHNLHPSSGPRETSSDQRDTSPAWKRTTDEHYVIPNGDQNIPFIAFCNTGHDPDGRWLLTTDISGLVQAWDIHNRESGQALRIGQDAQVDFGFDHENAGWALAFLDPRSFLEVQDEAEDGLFGRSDIPGLDTSRAMWDISATKFNLTGAQGDFVIPGETQSLSDGNFAPEHNLAQAIQGFANQAVDDPSYDDDESPDEIDSDEDEDGRREVDYASIFQPIRQLDVSFGDTPPSSTPTSEASSPEPPGENATLQEILDYGPPSTTQSPRPQALRRILTELGYLGVTAASESSIPSRDAFVRFRSPTSLCPLSCPILHTSVRNMYLLQPSYRKSREAKDHLPAIVLADAFQQRIRHRQAYYLERIERSCMLAQIPSLGLLIVGNQKGRVAVLSLVKSRMDVDIKIKRQAVKTQKWVYGMRLEAILPFAGQERAGYRPLAALHGVAVGPMQGSENLGSEDQRWRVMVMYQDHTILSYEVGRKRTGVDVADVMI